MDGLQLRDEAVRDRIRAAEEFLDPSEKDQGHWFVHATNDGQMIPRPEATEQRLY